MPLLIKGLQKTSLVDYPGKVCAVVFLPDCTFRCPYCQNPELINDADKLPQVAEQELFDLLRARGKWLDAVCITGGEPTIHAGLPEFVRKIKNAGFLVKLDTNGSNPRMLKQLLDEKLVDYVAMDIKAPIEKYAEVANVPVDLRKIEESVGVIRSSGVDYEFRTTVLPRLLSEADMMKIGQWLKGSRKYAIQQFRSVKTLDASYARERPYSAQDLRNLAEKLKQFFGEVEVRGV